MIVSILRSWDWPDFFRQTPKGEGVWSNVKFVDGMAENTDYVIVLNGTNKPIEVCCETENIWAIMQEPPDGVFKKLHKGNPVFHRVYTSNTEYERGRYFPSHGALPWHVNKNYDELSDIGVPEKQSGISWVTSSKSSLQGHRDRLQFMESLSRHIDFELFGHGFNKLADKWDGVAPYKYSLAVENFSNKHYWTEKITDCYLAWTMPIYYGCSDIERYFPPESMIKIDIHDPDSFELIHEAVAADLWRKNIDAISHARKLVLNKYNIFPFLTEEIDKHENARRTLSRERKVTLIPAIDYESEENKSAWIVSKMHALGKKLR